MRPTWRFPRLRASVQAPPSRELILFRGKEPKWVSHSADTPRRLPSSTRQAPPLPPSPLFPPSLATVSLPPYSILPPSSRAPLPPPQTRQRLGWKQLYPVHSTLLRSPDPILGSHQLYPVCMLAEPSDQARLPNPVGPSLLPQCRVDRAGPPWAFQAGLFSVCG